MVRGVGPTRTAVKKFLYLYFGGNPPKSAEEGQP